MNDPTDRREGIEEVRQSADTHTAVMQFFPVAIGHYANFPDLDVEKQAGRVLDLLAPFGARHDQWAAPPLELGAAAVERRLLEWSQTGSTTDGPRNSVLYWVGHGWSDGIRASLAHADSPARVGAAASRRNNSPMRSGPAKP